MTDFIFFFQSHEKSRLLRKRVAAGGRFSIYFSNSRHLEDISFQDPGQLHARRRRAAFPAKLEKELKFLSFSK